MATAPKDEFLGAVLDGLYRVQSVLGEGGMARVYLAENLKLKGRTAVVKRPMLEEVAAAGRLSQAGFAAEDLRERFQTEIQQLIDARHDAIVDILSQGVHAGIPYYVLEHMDAGSLEDRMRKGRQAPEEVLGWLKPIADALDYMHRQQVVHRDVKPSNILFRRKGDREQACLSDFGIVKVLGGEGGYRTLTLNTSIGTYAFMAPEQSDPKAKVDGRADQYALAATVYQALTWKVLFHDVAPLDRPGAKKFRDPIRVDAPGMAPQLPREAADAVMRGVSRDPDDRFPTCTAFAEAFELGLKAPPPAPRRAPVAPAPPPPAPPPPPRPRARPLVLVLLLAALAGAGLVARSAIRGKAPDREEEDRGNPTGILIEQALDRAKASDWDTVERLIEDAKSKGAKEIPDALRRGLEPPALSIDRAEVEGAVARLTVTLMSGRGEETITSNGKTWRQPPGTWEIEVPLEGAGRQTIKVAVLRRGKEAVVRTTTVEIAPPPPPAAVPSWAKVSKEQLDAATRLGVPVAFENPIGMRFVLIPPGKFTMGSPENEEGRGSDETRHEVEITKACYIAIHETTNANYRRFRTGHSSGDYRGESLDGADQPVVRVSHNDAGKFVGWLDTQDRRHKHRLPTEAEWEYACRAGTTGARYWSGGAAQGHRHANGNDPSAKAKFGWTWDGWPSDDGYLVAAPVGKLGPNGWGLYDMVGNVYEWCEDWYGEGYYAESPRQDPPGPGSGSVRVVRGGSWVFNPWSLRSADRFRGDPGGSVDFCGFRVVAVSGAPE